MTLKHYEGKMLIASPFITSTIFKNTVIYIHTGDSTGSMGIMANRPMDYDDAARWSEQLSWQYPEKIFHGGPMEGELGFVVHSNDYARETTIQLNEHLSYTGGKIVVHDINKGMGPSQFILYTGYCKWDPGQLESEVENEMWIVADFDKEYFFNDLDREEGWEYSINLAAQHATEKLFDALDTNNV